MKRQSHSVNTNSKLARHLLLKVFAVLIIGFLSSAYAADLRVMKTGLGKGWITGTFISCGIVSSDTATDTDTTSSNCNATSTTDIVLTANIVTGSGSTFAGWGGDCTGTSLTCTVPMTAMRSVRAKFTLGTPVPPPD